MISSLDVRGDVSRLQAQLRQLGKESAQRAIVAAINETATTSRKQAQSAVQRLRNVTATGARRQLQLDRATKATLKAIISLRSGPIPLRYFNPRMTREGVMVNVTGQNKGPVMKDGRKAFIVRAPRDVATGRRNRRGAAHPELVGEVMVRMSGRRLHIKKLYGPSLGSVLNKREVIDLLKSTAAPLFIEKLRQKVQYEAELLGFEVY